MYTPILNEDGTVKEPVAGFSPQLGITTLEEYFNWLPELKKGNDGKPTKYVVLPLDEPHFIIDANSRAITIPADFKKNGIAVQGDDLAEVVYFEVDRYFDSMDLNNCEIFIQWETPKKANGSSVKSVSDVFIRDIESVPGKLIFGWAISDALTGSSGALKFSVKFLQWEKDSKKIAYSLNTLTAQVMIHQSIGLDMENDSYVIDNANDRLLERIEASEVVGGLQAATPRFLEDLSGGEYDIIPYEDGTLSIYVVATADDTGAVSYVWKRRDLDAANAPGESELEIPNSSTTEMVEVTELDQKGYPILKEGHFYANPTGDGYTPYKGSYDLATAYPDKTLMPKFYENKAVLVVDKYGVYTAEARNRIFNSLSKARSKSAIFKRPDPIRVDIKENPQGHIIGTNSAILNPAYDKTPIGEIRHQWYKAPEKNLLSEKFRFFDLPVGGEVSYSDKFVRILCPTDPSIYYEQNVGEGGQKDRFYITMRNYAPKGAVALRMNGVNNLAKDPDPIITGTEELEILKDKAGYGVEGEREYYNFWIHIAGFTNGAWKAWPTGKGENEFIGYRYIIEWYDENMNAINSSFITIQLANEDNFNAMDNFQEIDGATSESFEALEEGLYRAIISRIRNNASIAEKSIEYRVTLPTQMPVFEDGTYDGAILVSLKDLLNGTKSLFIEMSDIIPYDEYEVTWMLYCGDDPSGDKEDLQIAKFYTTDRISTFNPADLIYSNIFEENEVDVEGRYYAIVRTKRNGVFSESTEKPSADNMFIVTGA